MYRETRGETRDMNGMKTTKSWVWPLQISLGSRCCHSLFTLSFLAPCSWRGDAKKNHKNRQTRRLTDKYFLMLLVAVSSTLSPILVSTVTPFPLSFIFSLNSLIFRCSPLPSLPFCVALRGYWRFWEMRSVENMSSGNSAMRLWEGQECWTSQQEPDPILIIHNMQQQDQEERKEEPPKDEKSKVDQDNQNSIDTPQNGKLQTTQHEQHRSRRRRVGSSPSYPELRFTAPCMSALGISRSWVYTLFTPLVKKRD